MKVIDPVCGMQIGPIRAASESRFQEQTYYFCSQECKGKLDSEPLKYTQKTHELQHRI
jgi:P-type Cu+ transporter